MIEYRPHAMRHAPQTPLSFDVLTHSTLTEAQNFVLITKTKTTREAFTRKHEKRPEARVRRHERSAQKHACGDTTNHQSPAPQEVNNRQVQDVIVSVVISDSVVHLSTSGPHECESQHIVEKYHSSSFFGLSFSGWELALPSRGWGRPFSLGVGPANPTRRRKGQTQTPRKEGSWSSL